MFLYETHCHTAISSKCAAGSAEEIADMYAANGFSGIFVTDHFLNGNTTVHDLLPEGSYEEKVALFCEGYRKVKEAAQRAGRGLQVFFGLEYSYRGSDLLLYGWNEETLKRFPEILSLKTSEFITFAKERGAFIVQAHPFRERDYIDHIRLFTGAEGTEACNACEDERSNFLAQTYAKAYHKPTTAGSDMHRPFGQKTLAGTAFETPLKSEEDFIARVRAGEGKAVCIQNVRANL
ncbi:MAG: PHP domain-containing protein [Candidatus Borkfalkiaceae bacterium]|nr:PHP domain-containing protein [Clostridia bacterium]MDY6222544.1 PHP domain-containing protein [Christensenellaceae bacterium]